MLLAALPSPPEIAAETWAVVARLTSAHPGGSLETLQDAWRQGAAREVEALHRALAPHRGLCVRNWQEPEGGFL